MIFKKSILGIDDPKKLYLRDRIEFMVEKLNISFSTYKNDFYKILQETIKVLKNIDGFNFKGIKKEYERTPEVINTYFDSLKIINGLNNIALLRGKEYLRLLASNTDATSIEIEKMIKKITPLVNAAENMLFTKSNSSIKDEFYFSLIFNNFEVINSSTLSVNINENCLCLPFVNITKIPYFLTEKNISINGVGININKQSYKSESLKLITPGYFYGKFFDLNPNFDNTLDISNIYEDDSKSFYVESYEDKKMIVSFEVLFNSGVNKIGSIFLKYGNCSSLPKIEKILGKYKSDVEYTDITNKCFSKDLVYKNIKAQKNNQEAFVGSGHQYPIHEITINENDIEQLKIFIAIENSEEIEFEEINIIEDKKVTRTFNFLESLYIKRYETLPLDIETLGIVKENIDNEIKNKQINKKTIAKKYLNLNELSFKNIQVFNNGEFISKTIGRSSDINSIELISNEHIPEGLTNDSIQYYITTDNVNWLKIVPVNRSESGKKIIILDRNNSERDKLPPANMFKLKIIMNNNNTDLFPKVYGVLLRIKESL